MDYTTLGRTGLRVSVMGLGCGGHSRLGQSTGRSAEESIAIVRAALDHGVTFFDTAESYGTETILGKGLASVPREQVVISTKVSPATEGRLLPPAHVASALEASLRRLQTDYVDVYLLHGLSLPHYDQVVTDLLPELLKLREQGKVKHIGVTEAFASDPGHAMLARAVQDDHWDVVMVGFNLLNQSARERVLSATRRKNIGVLNMFAVRRALAGRAEYWSTVEALGARELIEPRAAKGIIASLVGGGRATNLQDIAYRFCRCEPGIHVVLSGTGSPDHLAANAASLARPPLPAEAVARLKEIFARVDDVSGN